MTEELRAIRRALRWLKKAEKLVAKREKREAAAYRKQSLERYAAFRRASKGDPDATAQAHSDQQVPLCAQIPQTDPQD